MVRHEHEPLLGRVWELRQNLTAYDGVYVALAEMLGCPLVTLDRRLAGVAADMVQVETITE
ncbi:MAG: twitching motility protein PilT [Actinobacteria bacterium]|nr:twitching motility protein PilT [Actinomycetota bacterium]